MFPAFVAIMTGALTLVAGAPVPTSAAVRTLSLDEALRELESQNLTLAQARSRAAESAAIVRQSWAPLLPTLSASGSYTRNSDQASVVPADLLAALMPGVRPAPGTLPPPVIIQPIQSVSATGTVRVPLLVPSALFDLASAKASARASDATSEATRIQLRAALAQSAWVAAMGEEIVGASERAVDTAREQEGSARRAVEAGTGAPLSILQAQTETTRRESDLVRARAELERARLAVGVLLGHAESVRVIVGPPAPATPLDPNALSAEALERRAEARALEAEVVAAERQLDSARWRLAPQISASASAFASDVPFPTGKNTGWRVTLDVTWSIYDGGFRYGKARQAAAALTGAEAARGAERVAIVQEVKDAVRDIEVARERLRLGERQRAFAAETAASAKRSFEAGVAGSIDVLDANDRLYQAEVALANARAQLGVSLVALDRALGSAG